MVSFLSQDYIFPKSLLRQQISPYIYRSVALITSWLDYCNSFVAGVPDHIRPTPTRLWRWLCDFFPYPSLLILMNRHSHMHDLENGIRCAQIIFAQKLSFSFRFWKGTKITFFICISSFRFNLRTYRKHYHSNIFSSSSCTHQLIVSYDSTTMTWKTHINSCSLYNNCYIFIGHWQVKDYGAW